MHHGELILRQPRLDELFWICTFALCLIPWSLSRPYLGQVGMTAGILAIVRGQAVFDTANVVALVFIFAGVVLVVIGYKYYVRHGLPPVGSDGKLRA